MEGLSLLENRKKDKDFYDTFMWELASINVEVGCLLQDCLSVGTYSEESVSSFILTDCSIIVLLKFENCFLLNIVQATLLVHFPSTTDKHLFWC